MGIFCRHYYYKFRKCKIIEGFEELIMEFH